MNIHNILNSDLGARENLSTPNPSSESPRGKDRRLMSQSSPSKRDRSGRSTKKQGFGEEEAALAFKRPAGDLKARFLPYETRDPDIKKHLEAFDVTAVEDIANIPKHIPYRSGKRDFVTKTGREAFEGESNIFTSRSWGLIEMASSPPV